ncbi:MAG TPA: ornithine cyclodeaminase family protein [Acidimicrobiia bacterium]|nr:ornithine cyclodeaminase family protein [Acidimicrobiia bacterium]
MGDLFVLTEQPIRSLVGFGDEELAAVEAVYPLISRGEAVMPPIMRIDIVDHNGEVDVKSAYLPGYDGIAIKVSAGFFDNPGLGLPSLGGFMMVLDSRTGVPAAALFDNGYLTDLRTALAGAVAARHLARAGPVAVAVLGTGAQARYQVEALKLVRELASLTIWGRRREAAEKLAADLGGDPAATIEEAVAGADLVVTATPATEGLMEERHLRPGLHITAVGSDAEHKRELGEGVLAAADLVVVDSAAQSLRLGEARSAVEEGYDAARLVELGAVVSARHPGRSSEAQITICDLTGTGAQDTAIAALTVSRARERGVGDVIAT